MVSCKLNQFMLSVIYICDNENRETTEILWDDGLADVYGLVCVIEG